MSLSTADMAAKSDYEGGTAEYLFGYCAGQPNREGYEDPEVARLVAVICAVAPELAQLDKILEAAYVTEGDNA
jgi:hypothetical protein